MESVGGTFALIEEYADRFLSVVVSVRAGRQRTHTDTSVGDQLSSAEVFSLLLRCLKVREEHELRGRDAEESGEDEDKELWSFLE